jgi:hypothetical protein
MKNLYESILNDIEVTLDKGNASIKKIIKQFLDTNYSITTNNGKFIVSAKPDKDGLYNVSVNGSVFMIHNDLEELTNGLFKFTNIRGSFNLGGCKKLKTLKNGPISVLGEFNISRCTSLDSLEYCPRNVAGDFTCFGTKFTKKDIKAACYHSWRQITDDDK